MSDKNEFDDEGVEDFAFADMPKPSDMPSDDSGFGFDDDGIEDFGAPVGGRDDDGTGGFDKPFEDDEEAFPQDASAPDGHDEPRATSAPLPPDEDVFGSVPDAGGDAGFPGDAEETDEPAQGGNKLVRNAIYAVAAVLVVGFGYVGYGIVSPMLGGGESQMADAGAASAPEFDLGAPVRKTGAAAPSLPPPTLPSATAVADKETLPSGILPASGGDDFGASAPTAAALGAPSPELPSLPAVGEAKPVPAAVPAAAVDGSALAALTDENRELRRRLDDVATRLAALESRPVQDQAPLPVAQPPAKPQIVKGWTLKGAQGDVAWVDGPGGFREVRPGTEIDGVGTVKDVTRYEDAWVVITTAGIILR